METKLKIYEKFVILFYEKGFNNVDIYEVLSENTIPIEVFNKYFTDKSSILYIIYKNMYTNLLDNLDNLSTSFPYSLNKFQSVFDFLCEFVSNNGRCQVS